MIGTPNGCCVYQVCDNTNTRLFADTFMVLYKDGEYHSEGKTVSLCQDHVSLIIERRHAGKELCFTREGWVYIDEFRWPIS